MPFYTFYSYIHRNIPMRFVTCEPPLGISDPKGYLDETDILYNNPLHFFQTYFEDQIGNKTLDWAVDKPNNDFTHVLDPQTRPNLNSLPWTRLFHPQFQLYLPQEVPETLCILMYQANLTRFSNTTGQTI
ncbi:hypothetical protein BASA83_010590 [Batrachochytrium salamandrivorans]|nr:hypothetical protein BASA83_010590 [Batrachochytrium salamandrivorans]